MSDNEMELFRPRREDGRAAWRVVYDWIEMRMMNGQLQLDAVVTHRELLSALNADQDSTYYAAVARATVELQSAHGRTLRSERGVGYRLVAGMGMLRKGETHVDRSRRAFKRGLDTVSNIDEGDIEQASDRLTVRRFRAGMQAVLSVLEMQVEKVAEHDRQIAELKSARIDDRVTGRAYTAEQLADLEARMEERLREQQAQIDRLRAS